MCLAAAGCGPKQAPVPVSAPIGSADLLKRDLQNVVETGAGESALQGVEMGIKALEDSHPHKADLQKKFQQLSHAGSPEDRKKIAGEMLTLAGGGN
jgi:hypothetical protein